MNKLDLISICHKFTSFQIQNLVIQFVFLFDLLLKDFKFCKLVFLSLFVNYTLMLSKSSFDFFVLLSLFLVIFWSIIVKFWVNNKHKISKVPDKLSRLVWLKLKVDVSIKKSRTWYKPRWLVIKKKNFISILEVRFHFN